MDVNAEIQILERHISRLEKGCSDYDKSIAGRWTSIRLYPRKYGMTLEYLEANYQVGGFSLTYERMLGHYSPIKYQPFIWLTTLIN